MSTVVETRYGKIEGVQHGALFVFKGIPYAAPPVGERRWLPPSPPAPWSGVKRAAAFGNAGPQPKLPLEILPGLVPAEPQSEDCLYLNVWTPGLDAAKRPVLVWIHGGAFMIGSGTLLLTDAVPLAARCGAVLVTINYRLGPFGFLRLRELTNGAIPSTGNEGLLDQVAALEWVRDNIAAFGGDPRNVTIFGESAGGMSVGSLLGMPKARGLFHRAIPQSGAAHTANTRERAVRIAERFGDALGGRAADRLRRATTAELVAAHQKISPFLIEASRDPEIGGMPLQPTIDGEVLPVRAIDAIAGGSAAGVPVLIGSTLDEQKLFLALNPAVQSLDEAGLLERLRANLPDPGPVVESYRKARSARGAPTTPPELLSAIETDRVFRTPALRLADAQRKHERRVFTYLVTWPSPFLGGAIGACHAIELGPLFGVHDQSPATAAFFGSGPEADALARGMQDAWVAFARSGDPSCDSLGAWAPYEPTRRATMLLGAKCELATAPYDEERAAWERAPDSALGAL